MKNFLKYAIVILVLILSIVACESDLENVGVGLVDNDTFDTNKIAYSVDLESKKVLKNRADGLPINPLGVYETDAFGQLEAGFATQVSLPGTGVTFGDNAEIDMVVIDIPYDATKEDNYSDGKPQFSLNNIYGDQDVKYTLIVSKLETFLNTLDPEDPTKNKEYYTDETYQSNLPVLFQGLFKPEKNDTVLYVRRPYFDSIDDQGVAVEDNDTIIKTDKAPSIKLELNKTFFTDNFVNGNEADFESQDRFNLFLKGLLFKVEENTDGGSVMMLNIGQAKLSIYYTNDMKRTETDTDLNGNGVIDTEPVDVKTKQTMTFGFAGIRAATFNRDYAGTATLDNNLTQNKKIYIQGAAGSLVSLDAFSNVDEVAIRAENWLINEANLVLHVDQEESGNDVPPRLFLYKIDEDGDDTNDNAQILDMLTEGEAIVDGYLQKEDDDGDDDTTEKPVKYRFRITDYISEIFKNEEPTQPVKFGIKAMHTTDLTDRGNPGDTIIREFSWDPRGVVIYGNDYLPTDVDYDKRLKLEIFYSKLNE